MENKMDIAVVVVTYNRLDCLKKSISFYESQSYLPKYIIIVNNCSTDGTDSYLNEWKKDKCGNIEKIVINTEENLGGAGGFYIGLDHAQNLDADWIWVSDDDAYAEADTFEKLVDISKKIDINETAAFCSAVWNHNKFDLNHRRRIEKNKKGIFFVDVPEHEYNENEYFEIDQGSYVGMLINKEALKKVGLTKREFFIYYDDTEHSMRLRKAGKIYCVPSSRTVHDVDRASEISWKDYYGIRNKLILINEYFGKGYSFLDALKVYKHFVFTSDKKYTGAIKKMYIAAVKDGLKNKIGLHSLYKPGFKFEK